MSFTELDFTTLPDSPIKYISIKEFCFTSYSAKTCLQAPQGGTALIVLLWSDFAEIAI